MWFKKPTLNKISSWNFLGLPYVLFVRFPKWKYFMGSTCSSLINCPLLLCGWCGVSRLSALNSWTLHLYIEILQRQIFFDQLTLWFICKSYEKIFSHDNKTVNPPQDGLLHFKLVLFVYFLYLMWTESVQYRFRHFDERRVICYWIMKSVQPVTNIITLCNSNIHNKLIRLCHCLSPFVV